MYSFGKAASLGIASLIVRWRLKTKGGLAGFGYLSARMPLRAGCKMFIVKYPQSTDGLMQVAVMTSQCP